MHSGIRKNWLRRRFILEGAELFYYDGTGARKGAPPQPRAFHLQSLPHSKSC